MINKSHLFFCRFAKIPDEPMTRVGSGGGGGGGSMSAKSDSSSSGSSSDSSSESEDSEEEKRNKQLKLLEKELITMQEKMRKLVEESTKKKKAKKKAKDAEKANKKAITNNSTGLSGKPASHALNKALLTDSVDDSIASVVSGADGKLPMGELHHPPSGGKSLSMHHSMPGANAAVKPPKSKGNFFLF